MIHISEASNLAVHALARLAQAAPGRWVSAAEIARGLGRSPSHLAKVLPLLAARGWLASTRGSRGGYRLACDPHAVRLIDVIEWIEGPLRTDECLLGERICRPGSCLFGGDTGEIGKRVRDRLERATIGDFAPAGRPAPSGERAGRPRAQRRTRARRADAWRRGEGG
ncbi:MAG: Rrf2 family transcriptional regulator [Candidatus Eisenbacteria bacterium]|uniref:Rrf2 family transcriptional regulator n=1 Tax=Eiseniibacteriota bacterium TaxID=2212470 RepID=A0A937XEA9_UNCEI|nr:Rrf2 family transcriptional regulator [Candidatus Eisenbacteria bacterium]